MREGVTHTSGQWLPAWTLYFSQYQRQTRAVIFSIDGRRGMKQVQLSEEYYNIPFVPLRAVQVQIAFKEDVYQGPL